MTMMKTTMIRFHNTDGNAVLVNPQHVVMIESADHEKNGCTRLFLAHNSVSMVVVKGSEDDTLTALGLALEAK